MNFLLIFLYFLVIATAAIEFIFGGDKESLKGCRSPEIVSDAAYAIFNKDSKKFTGSFFIDDEVLKVKVIFIFSFVWYVKWIGKWMVWSRSC